MKQKVGATAQIAFAKGLDVVDVNFPESDLLKSPPEKVRAGINAAAKVAWRSGHFDISDGAALPCKSAGLTAKDDPIREPGRYAYCGCTCFLAFAFWQKLRPAPPSHGFAVRPEHRR